MRGGTVTILANYRAFVERSLRVNRLTVSQVNQSGGLTNLPLLLYIRLTAVSYKYLAVPHCP